MLYYTRHGLTVCGESHVFAGGSTETPLTPAGRRETQHFARKNSKALKTVDLLIASPQGRAQETAEIILDSCKPGIPIETVEALREWKLGEWEGTSYLGGPLLFTKLPPDPPDGEPYLVFKNRVLTALFDIARRPEENILVVAHGAVWFAYAHWQDPFLSKTTGCIDNNTLEQMEREALRHALDYSLACG